MKRLTILTAALAALTLSPLAATAHTDSTEYVAYEWQCYGVPNILRRQATHQQRFELGNTSRQMLRYYFFVQNFTGVLSRNLTRAKTGRIAVGKTVTVTNSQLQYRNVDAEDEEGAELCFSVESGGLFNIPVVGGSVSVREYRRMGSTWLAHDLHRTDSFLLVDLRSSIRKSTGATDEDLEAQMEFLRSP